MLLAEKKLREAFTLLELYRVRALRSRRQLTDAEVDVGRARLTVRRSGYHIASRAMNSGGGDSRILHPCLYQLLLGTDFQHPRRARASHFRVELD